MEEKHKIYTQDIIKDKKEVEEKEKVYNIYKSFRDYNMARLKQFYGLKRVYIFFIFILICFNDVLEYCQLLK